MKTIEELDDEQAAFTLYRVVESELGAGEIDDDAVETELRGSLATVLKDQGAAEQLLHKIAHDEKAAGQAARIALSAIRERGLLPDGEAALDALLQKPPASETLDFGASICGIALLSLLLTMRAGVKHKRTAAGPKGTTETEIDVSIGSEKLADLAQNLWARLRPH
jgi:hypothetical protein